MNQVYQNINKDMFDCDLIDVESLDFSDAQTWLLKIPDDSGNKVDLVEWQLSCDWPINEDEEYLKTETEINRLLDEILKNEVASMPDKHKFDSRTYIKPKKKAVRPSIQSIVEVPSNPPSLITTPCSPSNQTNKYLTYNKYSMPLGPVSPMLRLKTFNVDTNTENSTAVKEYAMKRRSLVQEDDPQLEDGDTTLVSETSERLSVGHSLLKPINIDLSQPAHNIHNTFNKGHTNMMNERGSLNMYQSVESLMRMSPPSLVSSILMENSGTFNPESIDGRRSVPSQRDSGILTSGRASIDCNMMTSMTLSILDEKDMSTSFLSQTTNPDNDSLMDSLPPSLVSSVNSSVVASTKLSLKPDGEQNVFSSPTYTHLEQSERLLSARPRCQLYNSFKRESGIKKSESYTKSKEESCQIDTSKILNENNDKPSPMTETVTLHYSNSKFRCANDAEKENVDTTFGKDDAFYNDMGIQKAVDIGKNSLNVTLDKQELNEIIQARQKLSLARKALPDEPEKLPNQVDTSPNKVANKLDVSPNKVIQLPNQVIIVPKQSMENASELLSRRRAMYNGFQHEEPTRDIPKRNATFKKVSPKATAMDTTVVYVKPDDNNQMIDINSATLNLIDGTENTLRQDEWCAQERAMVCSNESTDTGTFSSSSPPESVPESAAAVHDAQMRISSTPLVTQKRYKNDIVNLHSTISPIYDMVNDQSYTLTKAPSGSSDRVQCTPASTNSATLLKRGSAKRDILAGRNSPEKKILAPTTAVSSRMLPASAVPGMPMMPPSGLPRKSSLPTSKLRQYSSHKELNSIPGSSAVPHLLLGRGAMMRRGVYGSNPALSPTATNAPQLYNMQTGHVQPPARRESYIIVDRQYEDEIEKPAIPKPTPVLVRQGTETLRREGTDTIRKERPYSQLVAPKDPPTTRPYSIAGASQLRVSRPSTGPTAKTTIVTATESSRPVSSESRMSALPRPSRLPAPKRGLRPPSVYSVAHAADTEHY